MKSIIITGGTSGIGESLARLCIAAGYRTGVTGRRTERLEALREELGEHLHIRTMDVTRHEEARRGLLELAEEMGGMDIVVLNAGISNKGRGSSPEIEQQVIDINVSGFVQLFNLSWDYFEKRGRGQIVGISSIASLLGFHGAAAYNASKAFVSTYMQGYRQRSFLTDADITVTDIRPGFVESEMTDGQARMFWVAPTEKAARQILRAIQKRRHHACITRRWRLISALLNSMPNLVLDRIR